MIGVTRRAFATTGLAAMLLTGCTGLAAEGAQTLYLPNANGVEAETIFTGATNEPTACEGFLVLPITDCASGEFTATKEDVRKVVLKRIKVPRDICSDELALFETLYGRELQSCSAFAYEVRTDNTVYLAFDLSLVEAECKHTSNCIPFGLVDPIEIELVNAEIDNETEGREDQPIPAQLKIARINGRQNLFAIIIQAAVE